MNNNHASVQALNTGDSLTDTFSYQIKDSAGALSNVANINLTIKAINDIAVAGNDSFVTDED